MSGDELEDSSMGGRVPEIVCVSKARRGRKDDAPGRVLIAKESKELGKR